MERKHRRQMSPREIRFAENFIRKLTGWDLQSHVIERMTEKQISEQDVLDTLKWGEVIEVNSYGRVVLRLTLALNPAMRRGTCIVLSLRERALVTAWRNRPNDTHRTLDLSEYRWDVDAAAYLESLK